MRFFKNLFNLFFGTSEVEPERVSFSRTLFLQRKYGKKSSTPRCNRKR